MSDEDLLDLDENNNEDINRDNNRFQKLVEKVKLTAKERDDLAQAKDSESKARLETEKERDFYKGFNGLSSKYQGATEYQDKIWEKVKAGYDIEDATVSILNKEGKFTPTPRVEDRSTVAGGSASTGITDTEEKSVEKMSQSERLEILRDMESAGQFKL